MTAAFTVEHAIQAAYLVATALFILSLKWLSAPPTARRGVLAAELGMALAIGGTLLDRSIIEYRWIAIGLVLGSLIGVPLGLAHCVSRWWAPPSFTSAPRPCQVSH
jgi:NAD(P) transhydrogenase subunit beta